MALLIFGDPHLDDNYCNWDVLTEHIDIAASHPRIFGMNIGDSHNNWVGRLMRLYAEQDTSRKDRLQTHQMVHVRERREMDAVAARESRQLHRGR